MRRSIAHVLGPIAILAGTVSWLVAVPAVSAGDPCYHDFAMPSSTTETATRVTLMPCAFAPTVTRVDVGTTVTFSNGPDVAHLITGANQAWGSRDVELRPGQTVSYTFDKAGIYPFACALHRGMSGAIVVGDATAGAGTTTVVAGAGTAVPPEAGATSGTSASEPGLSATTALAVAAGILVGATAAFVVLRGRRRSVDPTTTPQTV